MMDSPDNFFNYLRRNNTKLLQPLPESTLPNSFYETRITLISKPDIEKLKNIYYWPISFMIINVTFLNKILGNQLQQCIK